MDEIGIDKSLVEWREVEGEIVALDLKRSDYFTLNRTGALLWSKLKDGTTRGELAQLLSSDFEISAEQASADVDEFLLTLKERGLLVEGGK